MAQLKDLLVNGSARVIGSLFANLSGNVLNFGICSTAAGTSAKTVTTGGTFELIEGSKVLVLFQNTDTSNAPTLNVNGTGAKSIKVNASDGVPKGFLTGQQYYWFAYDGSAWRIAGGGTTQIAPIQYGGTNNDSFTANRPLFFNGTKIIGSTNNYINDTALAINKTSITSGYNFEVNGNSNLIGSVTVGTSTSGALGIAQTDGVGRGISLYYGPVAAGIPEYGIAFAKTATFGTHGAVTSDWATYFTMSDTTTRGWIFRRGSTNVASIDGTGKLYLGYAASTANPGIYWNPCVESASDGSDVSAIYQIKSGVAGGTELRILQANDSDDVINIVSPYYIYLNSKRAFKINDAWLRINEDKGFSEGIYTGSSLVRTDNQLQVGDNGNKFYATSSGNGYFSNTLGIAGTNTTYKLYVNGNSYFNGTLDNPDGRLSFVQNKTIIGNTVDWNTLTTPGCYKIQMATWGDATTLHSPNEAQSNLYSFGLLFVFRGSTGDGENRVEQIYFPHYASNDHPIYCRMHNGSSFDSGWQNWHRLARGSLAKKLTIQANGTQKGQFNNSADVTVNLGNVVQDLTGANSGNANNINADTFAGMTRQQWLNTVYPVGSIYMSVSATSPATLFGGTWESLGGRFLIGQNGTYTAGSTGGEASHTLTLAEAPAHTHGRGTMNITGSIDPIGGSEPAKFGTPSGAIQAYSTVNYYSGCTNAGTGNYTRWDGFKLNAASGWSGETDSKGGGGAHNNMPPYLAVYMWKRTA